MDWTKKFATPAGNTIRGILDCWFPGLLVQAKNILRTDRKTDPAPGTDFLVQFVYSHESLPSKLLEYTQIPVQEIVIASETKPCPEQSEGTLEIATGCALATTPSDCHAPFRCSQ
jgi:hypothetical protein